MRTNFMQASLLFEKMIESLAKEEYVTVEEKQKQYQMVQEGIEAFEEKLGLYVKGTVYEPREATEFEKECVEVYEQLWREMGSYIEYFIFHAGEDKEEVRRVLKETLDELWTYMVEMDRNETDIGKVQLVYDEFLEKVDREK